MKQCPEIKPRTNWWKMSALATALTMLPELSAEVIFLQS